MKFARVYVPWRARHSSLVRLIEATEPDYVQLDFGYAEQTSSGGDLDRDLEDSFQVEFLNHMKRVHKWLFLRPDFAVLTNAGSTQVVRCMESLAQFLMEHGSDEMPIAAVRGTNLLATIDSWLPPGIANSGRKALSAQVEIGGGPLAIALAEGARIVVTGIYDRAAPLLAAVVAGGAAAWHDHNTLAALAVASERNDSVIEWSDTGVTVSEPFDAPSDSHYADVVADVGSLKLNSTPRGTWLVSGVIGRATDSMWNLRITLEAGYRAAALIEGDTFPIREFCEQFFSINSFTFEEFISSGDESSSLSRVFLHGESLRQCQQQLEMLESWATRSGCRLGEPAPSIHQLTESLVVRIPADQVTLSVDTRPARDWL